ncbi:MAG TPA: hypothetical protein PKC10_02910 [Cyclobacteriaceae bacterium]|nr:hypothetical protein [Cyclobacteriaceae bacterium]
MIRGRISIELLGRKRFYIGLSIGLCLTILTYLFFCYFREMFRRQTFNSDLLIPTETEFFIYNFFFAASSVTFGFGATVWFWFHGLFSSKRPRRRINYISAYSIFWSMTLIYVVSRTGSNLTWILFGMDGYDDHLNLSSEFPLLLFLLPTVFFLNIWSGIRLSFRSGGWFLKSLGVYIVLSAILAFSSPIDQRGLNDSWNEYMAPYNQIVDNEIEKAQSKELQFSEKAVETIRFNRKERVVKQAKALKERFTSKTPIPTDSVVLELIAIKKTTIRALDSKNWNDKTGNWPFALPKDVYRQISISDDSTKNDYLREILTEYESIFKDDWDMVRESGLSDKYFNRTFIQRWYKEIFLELQHSKESPDTID